jgi:hypothetical protein
MGRRRCQEEGRAAAKQEGGKMAAAPALPIYEAGGVDCAVQLVGRRQPVLVPNLALTVSDRLADGMSAACAQMFRMRVVTPNLLYPL